MAQESSSNSCLALLPIRHSSVSILNALKSAARRTGTQVTVLDETEPGGLPISQLVSTEIAKADIIVADLSDRDPLVFYEVGLAQAMGKPAVFIREANTPLLPFVTGDTGPARIFDYVLTPEGMTSLRRELRRMLTDFKRFPRKFQVSQGLSSRLASTFVIDFDRLEPRELENLCFELLTQMGFRRVQWEKDLREIDAVAMLPRKDPDGFDYQELWLISMGLHAPPGMLLELPWRDPEYFWHRLLRSREQESLVRQDAPITILLMLPQQSPSAELLERQKRFEPRLREQPYPFTVRVRIWDRLQLTNLIQQYPQIGQKYFSEEGRSQSKYRKSPEELYRENVDLSEQMQTALAALREERDKRVRAERDAVWKDLSFTAAHKLGNPLFAIETDLQGLKEKLPGGDVSALAEEIGVSLEKAKVIIEQFKSLTKAQEISPRPTDVGPLLRNACRVAREKGIHVEINLPKELPQIKVDPDRITECFDELVANSLHWFDKSEKRLTVTVNLPTAENLPPQLDDSHEYLRVRFEDNGCGIAAECKERVFNPFYTTYPHGTGLGLALVQRIVEGHGGLILENGKQGDGAGFDVYLPVASNPES